MKPYIIYICIATAIFFAGCKIKYDTTSSSIDYTVIKTITINDFPNQAPMVYPPLSQSFTEGLRDKYTRQTKLRTLPSNGDIELEGEITGYDVAPMAIKEDAYSSMTKLTMTVRVRFTNRANPDKDFEQNFSAYREFDSNLMLQDIQDSLNEELTKEIADQIYNATVADW